MKNTTVEEDVKLGSEFDILARTIFFALGPIEVVSGPKNSTRARRDITKGCLSPLRIWKRTGA